MSLGQIGAEVFAAVKEKNGTVCTMILGKTGRKEKKGGKEGRKKKEREHGAQRLFNTKKLWVPPPSLLGGQKQGLRKDRWLGRIGGSTLHYSDSGLEQPSPEWLRIGMSTRLITNSSWLTTAIRTAEIAVIK